MDQVYLDTARLLTQVAPLVFVDQTFALKGGTAINLFIRDMPRLSVDLDLVFQNHLMPRELALAMIARSIRESATRLTAHGFQTRTIDSGEAGETKLMIRRGYIEVKVEVNFVMRGTVYPVRKIGLTPKARELLLADLEIPVLSLEDVYGGKLVAAMDRQHPRDLFDVMELLLHGGITPEIRRAFVVYLASHNRPVHEVLFPVMRNIEPDYKRTFVGMTSEPVSLNALHTTREHMVHALQTGLDENERGFLLSLVENRPEWSRIGFEHIAQLPGILWKVRNMTLLEKTNPSKFREQADTLRHLLR